MSESRFLRRGYWPIIEMPQNVLEHYVSTQLTVHPNVRLEISIDSYDDLMDIVQTNESFEAFWLPYRSIYKDKEDEYLLPYAVDESVPFEFQGIEQEYYMSLYEEEFIELPEDEQQKIEAQFKAMTVDSYQDVLKGEALRLDCDVSEVRPLCLVLPLASDGHEESKLVDLPDGMLLKIIDLLDTLDVFRVTLVCKRWKNLIYNNPRNLRRAEHAKTTHLITFTDWAGPEKTQSWLSFERQYSQLSLGLFEWCCRVTEHLDTVILPSSVSFSTLQTLLQSCPKLRNLQCGYGSDYVFLNDGLDETSHTVVDLPTLEFYCSYLCSSNLMSELNKEILLSCESLRYFGGQLKLSQTPELDTWTRMQCSFKNLAALDLARYSVHILDILSDTDGLQLKYFRLGYRDYSNPASRVASEEARVADVLNKILGKLRKLEIFIMMCMPGIGNSTISLLTQLKSNLNLAAFAEYSTYDGYEGDEWEPYVLEQFGKMLLSNDPQSDLSQFCFVVNSTSVPPHLKEINLGFTFLAAQDWYNIAMYDVALNDLRVKRRLGIDF